MGMKAMWPSSSLPKHTSEPTHQLSAFPTQFHATWSQGGETKAHGRNPHHGIYVYSPYQPKPTLPLASEGPKEWNSIPRSKLLVENRVREQARRRGEIPWPTTTTAAVGLRSRDLESIYYLLTRVELDGIDELYTHSCRVGGTWSILTTCSPVQSWKEVFGLLAHPGRVGGIRTATDISRSECFKYLRSIVQKYGGIDKDVTHRIQEARIYILNRYDSYVESGLYKCYRLVMDDNDHFHDQNKEVSLLPDDNSKNACRGLTVWDVVDIIKDITDDNKTIKKHYK
ncbi:hypothetical protein KSP39_PZI006108 [Platanthera zijinensis]|uniref:Uncharacterized protein n=1 Tax=Platanthera zijinensis TaxID=2320716 RepID=A0AAP0BUR6_9ASPA